MSFTLMLNFVNHSGFKPLLNVCIHSLMTFKSFAVSSLDSARGSRKVRALSNKYLNFGMVLGMGIRFSKTTANKLGSPPSGLFAMNPIVNMPVHG